MSNQTHEGTATRNAADQRIESQRSKLRAARVWTGQEILKELEEQALEPRFDSDQFVGYFDRHSGKKALTSMPGLTGKTLADYNSALGKPAVTTTQTEQEADNMSNTEKKTSTKEKKAAAPKAPRKNTPTGVITVLAEKNPKREGSKAFNAFKLYKNGMTVEQFVAKGGTIGDVRWDVRHKFISLVKE